AAPEGHTRRHHAEPVPIITVYFSPPSSYPPFINYPSTAIPPPSATAATSVALSRPKAASRAFGSSTRNTVENLSCDGMPCFSFKNRLRNLSFAQPNSAISEQCCAPHNTARNAINMISTRSCRTFSALGSGTLSNAVRKSCIGDPLESAGVALRRHHIGPSPPPAHSPTATPPPPRPRRLG